MGGPLLLLLGVAFVISSLTLFALSKNRRAVVLDRLHFQHRRSSGSKTPPRSLSPDKKQCENIPAPDYKDVFPPSRRFTLGEILSDLPSILNKPLSVLASPPPDSRKACIPLTTSYQDLTSTVFTPTEFSTEEIRALGDFPDYATLSGVPLPQPYHNFDINKARPRPYRPFRWAYHQTMCESGKFIALITIQLTQVALTKMENDWWLELENTYVKRIKQRQDLFVKHGDRVLNSLPGSELACKELMEMSLQFLCARYPHYFRLDEDKMVFYNGILSTESDLKTTSPLNVLLDNVPEDFAIMLRDSQTGFYFFRAGVICSSLGWDLGTKIGMQLHEVHAPIPNYKEKMQFSMDRYVPPTKFRFDFTSLEFTRREAEIFAI